MQVSFPQIAFNKAVNLSGYIFNIRKLHRFVEKIFRFWPLRIFLVVLLYVIREAF